MHTHTGKVLLLTIREGNTRLFFTQYITLGSSSCALLLKCPTGERLPLAVCGNPGCFCGATALPYPRQNSHQQWGGDGSAGGGGGGTDSSQSRVNLPYSRQALLITACWYHCPTGGWMPRAVVAVVACDW